MKLAIFDFDGTLFPKDTLPFLLKQWKVNKYSKVKLLNIYLPLIPLYLKYKLGLKSNLSIEQMKLIAFQKFHGILKGMTEREIIQYMTTCSEAIIKLLNSEIVSEIQNARNAGFHTVILSGSYSLILNKVAEYLHMDTVIGTEIHFDDMGLIDISKQLNVACGTTKIERLQDHFKFEAIDWPGSCAYADSYSDIHVLQSVGQPIAVNPDFQLKSIAIQKNWRIISSKHGAKL
ncbi:MAG: hypothetical protein APF77_21850 [Clostridia bacterium BRH_c25]|nr:MAG: hypothetical protein APF77_21850 [Clostridia bacterium BRH_c25]